jgi:N-glycosylase/DNA lyase
MGQTFVWRRVGDGFLGSVAGIGVRVAVDRNHVTVEGNVPEGELTSLFTRYFDAERDVPALQTELARDPYVADAIRRHSSIRVLRQPFWECLASFILSSVNNVPRITRIVARLSQRFGLPFRLGNDEWFTFPLPERLAATSVESLVECGVGFRAKALRLAAQSVVDGTLDDASLRAASYEDARTRLVRLFGVGEKIADCVTLYSLDHFEACPLDVWMRRELERLYFDARETRVERIREFVRDRFGAWAGYAQLYLYHDARTRGR